MERGVLGDAHRAHSHPEMADVAESSVWAEISEPVCTYKEYTNAEYLPCPSPRRALEETGRVLGVF